jgi:uncharacterized protein (DUF1778 family)
MATAPYTPTPSRRSNTVKRPDRLDLRIRPEVRLLIDEAAEATGKNRQDFILDAARQAAETTLLDRRTIPLHDEAYKAFVAMLDAPAQPNANLRKSLTAPAVWE